MVAQDLEQNEKEIKESWYEIVLILKTICVVAIIMFTTVLFISVM